MTPKKKKNPNHMTKRWVARDTMKGTETEAQHRTHDCKIARKTSDHLIIENRNVRYLSPKSETRNDNCGHALFYIHPILLKNVPLSPNFARLSKNRFLCSDLPEIRSIPIRSLYRFSFFAPVNFSLRSVSTFGSDVSDNNHDISALKYRTGIRKFSE